MLMVADILLFCCLAWPFVAGAIVAIHAAASGKTDTENGRHPSQLAANLSLVSLGLTVLNVPLAVTLGVMAGGGVELGWMVEMPLAAVGCLLLHAGLVSQCFAPPRPEEDRALVARDAVPFWTTGLLSLAMMLEEPIARAVMLITAPVLAVILLDTGAGRAIAGWNTVRRTATGVLLALTGFLHPNFAVEGILAGLGVCLLAGLFPATLLPRGATLSRAGDALELLRSSSATIAVAGLLATFPLPEATATAFRGSLFVAGLVTLALASVSLRLGRANRIEAVARAGLGFAALAAGVTHPLIADLALLGLLLAMPWLVETPASRKARAIALWLLLFPGFCALLLALTMMAASSGVLAVAVILAVLPALRPACRLLPAEVRR